MSASSTHPSAAIRRQQKALSELVSGVERVVCVAVRAAAKRFPSVHRLLHQYDDAALALKQEGVGRLPRFREVHNELCVAVELLGAANVANVDSIEYEPIFPGCTRRFDFRVVGPEGQVGLVEVKTVYPEEIDDWEGYQRALDRGRIPRNMNVVLDRERGGGLIWHDSYASRTKLLEHTLEVEAKIEACGIDPHETPVHLAIVSSGMKLPESEVEPFVHFYRKNQYCPWDEFASMEHHYVAERGIKLQRTVAKFAYFERPTFEVQPRRVNWNVQWPLFVDDDEPRREPEPR